MNLQQLIQTKKEEFWDIADKEGGIRNVQDMENWIQSLVLHTPEVE